MNNHKFKVAQDIFVIPIKMPGIIKKQIKQNIDENTYEVEVKYQGRTWKSLFYESELSDLADDIS